MRTGVSWAFLSSWGLLPGSHFAKVLSPRPLSAHTHHFSLLGEEQGAGEKDLEADLGTQVPVWAPAWCLPRRPAFWASWGFLGTCQQPSFGPGLARAGS